jgi:hypothetical protein
MIMAEAERTDGYWHINDEAVFEYRDSETEEILDTVSFMKAKSLAAFFMWQMIESIGE